MLDVEYEPRFLRDYNKLDAALRAEVKEKVALFKDPKNHRQLDVHKLNGRMADRWSFSVDFRNRVVFRYVGKGKSHAVFLTVGDHSVYR